MSSLNIRDISPGLIRKVKTVAMIEGKTLRETVIDLLEQYSASFDFSAMKSNCKKEIDHE